MSDRPELDPLSEVLVHHDLHAEIYSSPRVCGAWRINPTGRHPISFHLIAEGGCWLHMRESREPTWLDPGDLVLFTRDQWHVLSRNRDIGADDTYIDAPEDGVHTHLLCGSIEFRGESGAGLVTALPSYVRISERDFADSDSIRALARLMALEARAETGGRSLILDRLAEVLVVIVLRHVLSMGIVQTGVLAALRDPRLREAIVSIHRDPGGNWTLDTLARVAGLSRTAFAARFTTTLAEPPMSYIARWRMQLAAKLLREGRLSVAQIAENLGYASEASFRRAFSRIRGETPGSVRRKLLPGTAPADCAQRY